MYVLGLVLTLSICCFVGKFTSLCAQRLLPGNYEPKYHVEVKKDTEKQNYTNRALYLIPNAKSEHLSVSS